jgi:hypothetical protein
VRFISDCSICCRSSSTAIISSKLYFEQVIYRHVMPSSWELFWAGKFVREFIQIWSVIRQVSILGQWKKNKFIFLRLFEAKMGKKCSVQNESFALPSNADAELITKSRDDVWRKLLKWSNNFSISAGIIISSVIVFLRVMSCSSDPPHWNCRRMFSFDFY